MGVAKMGVTKMGVAKMGNTIILKISAQAQNVGEGPN